MCAIVQTYTTHQRPKVANYKFQSIVDTREWIQESPYDRMHPIRGSGTAHHCDHCGAAHEVHVFLRDTATGAEINVGTACVTKLAPHLGYRVSTRALHELHRNNVRDGVA